MLKDSNAKPKSTKPSRSRGTTPALKRVVSTSLPVQEKLLLFEPIPQNAGFTAEVYHRGAHLYEMKAQDPSHYLECNLILEVEESGDESELKTVICHFHRIIDEQLNKFIQEDETLYGMAMIQFQMKVLEKLLMFCANHQAFELIIYMDDAQAEGFGIYHNFLVHYDETLTENGEQTEMIIPSNQQAFDDLTDFMRETNLRFCQELWRDQRFNPAIRQYLQIHPFA